MKFTPSTNYNIITNSVGYNIQYKVQCRVTEDLSESLSSNNWIDITEYVTSISQIKTRLEYEITNYAADSVNIKLFDINYFVENILTDSNLNNDQKYIEFKISATLLQNSRVSEQITLFYGYVNKESIKYTIDNELELEVYTPELLADKIPAYTLNTQYLTNTVSGSALFIPKITGIYVLDANVSGHPLKTGIHTLTYSPDNESIKLDEGREYFISSTEVVTLGNANETDYSIYGDSQNLKILIDYDRLIKGVGDDITDSLIVDVEGDTLPKQPYYSLDINNSLKLLYNKIGVTYTTQSFIADSWDNSLQVSYQNIPPGEITNKTSTAISYHTGISRGFVALSNDLYETDSDFNSYRLILSGSFPTNATIDKIVCNNSNTDLWIHYKYGSTHDFKKVTAVITGSVYGYHQSSSIYYDSGDTGHSNETRIRNIEYIDYNYSSSLYKRGIVYAADNAGVYFIDNTTLTGSLISTYSQNKFPEPDNLFVSGSSIILSGYNTAAVKKQIRKSVMINSSGNWQNINTFINYIYPTDNYLAYIQNKDVYIGFNKTSGSLYYFNPTTGGSIIDTLEGDYEIVATQTRTNVADVILSRTDIPNTYLHAYINDTYNITYKNIPKIYNDMFIYYPNVYKLIDTNNILYNFTTTPNLSLAPTHNYTGLTVRGYINNILQSFNLVGTINSNKESRIYQRVNRFGNNNTIGNGTKTLDNNNVINVTADNNKYKSAKYIELSAEDGVSVTYANGNYDVGFFENYRKVTIGSDIIPRTLYKNLIKNVYDFFSVDRILFTVTCIEPNYQWEILDAVNMNITNTAFGSKINGVTGVIYGVTYNTNGTSTLEILV